MPKSTIIDLNGQKYDAVSGKRLSPDSTKQIEPPSQALEKSPVRHTANTKGLSVDGVARPISRNRMSRSKNHTFSDPADAKAAQPSSEANTDKQSQKAISKSNAISKFGKQFTKKIDSFSPRLNDSSDKNPKNSKPSIRTFPPKFIPKPTEAAPQRKDHIIVERGLEMAQSHTQAAPPKDSKHARLSRKLHIRQKMIAPSAAVLAFAVIGGIFAYNKVPDVALHVAAQRTGVRASMPSYSPNGFKLKQPIHYNDDEINIEYSSNSDDRSFKVTQKASSWDSRTLLENFIETTQSQYQTLQVKGRTIYTYNNGDAAWVDGGTMYKIEGNSNLSSDQLLKIINSL